MKNAVCARLVCVMRPGVCIYVSMHTPTHLCMHVIRACMCTYLCTDTCIDSIRHRPAYPCEHESWAMLAVSTNLRQRMAVKSSRHITETQKHLENQVTCFPRIQVCMYVCIYIHVYILHANQRKYPLSKPNLGSSHRKKDRSYRTNEEPMHSQNGPNAKLSLKTERSVGQNMRRHRPTSRTEAHASASQDSKPSSRSIHRSSDTNAS
jgi:hypothetical protein